MVEKEKVASNLMWRLLERFGAQGVAFLVSIVLARVLNPEIYGTVALVTVFTSVFQVFVETGIGSSLVRKKEADDLDFSTAFYFNICLSFVLYIILFVFSPYIAVFYERPELTNVVRVLGLTVVVAGAKNIQQAYVSRNLLFKKFFFSTLAGTIGAAVMGIVLAYRGYGVWALVFQHLFNLTVDTVVLWFTVKWRPKKMFSFERLKGLYSYGWKILVSAIIDKIYTELTALIIGKVYSSSDLAYYNKGQQFPNLIVNNINAAIDSVLLPTMAKAQDQIENVRGMTRRAIKTSTFIMMPMMMGLAVCAEPLVRILLTDKWIGAVFYLRVFCFVYAFFPIHTANLNAIKALGRSDLFLKLEIIKKSVSLITIIISVQISVKVMALSLIFTSIMGQIINSWPNRKLLSYRYIDQVKDMLPQIILSCVMGGAVYPVVFLNLVDWITLLIQVVLGVLIYFAGSKLFHIDSYEYVVGIAKGYILKKSSGVMSSEK